MSGFHIYGFFFTPSPLVKYRNQLMLFLLSAFWTPLPVRMSYMEAPLPQFEKRTLIAPTTTTIEDPRKREKGEQSSINYRSLLRPRKNSRGREGMCWDGASHGAKVECRERLYCMVYENFGHNWYIISIRGKEGS